MNNYKIFSKKNRVLYNGKPSVLSEDDILSIIDGAFSSCHYWAFLHTEMEEWSEMPVNEGIASSEWCAKLLIDDDAIIYFSDAECGGNKNDPDFELWELTLKDLLKGFYLNRDHRKECDIDCMDGTSYDCILQYALFGEIIYG